MDTCERRLQCPAETMQSTRDTIRQKRINKRRNPRKKSLSPSDLKCDAKIDFKTNSKRSLTEINVKHRKSNIRRNLTHPLTSVDSGFDDVLSQVKLSGPMPESDESNLPPTSSDRDTEDDARAVPKFQEPVRPRWDSGSEMDSLVSIAVKRASARRRRAPDNAEWGVSSEAGEASEVEGGRMRPEDYRLVFVSSDSSCRDDTEDSSSTASSAAPPAPEDCDWDYFEPGTAGGATPLPPPHTNHSEKKTTPQPCPKTCSCGAEPRIVAVPVPVPVPFPAALWPALLAFQNPSAIHHWSTYPGFPQFDAATLARITSAAAAAVSAATAAATLPQAKTIEMSSVEKTDKAIQSEASTSINRDTINIDTDNAVDKQNSQPLTDNSTTGDNNMLIVNEVKSLVRKQNDDDVMPGHLDAENAFNSTSNSAESSDSENGVKYQSYDVTSGAPEEPATSDEDSEDSGGGGGGSFTRVFVVNPDDSSSDLEDNADSSGIDCDDSYERRVDHLEPVLEQVPSPNHITEENGNDNQEIVLVNAHELSDNVSINCVLDDEIKSNESSMSRRSSFMKFCDENMLNSEILESYNSFSPSQEIDDLNCNLVEIETASLHLPSSSKVEPDQPPSRKNPCALEINSSTIEKQCYLLKNQKESSSDVSKKLPISTISQVTENTQKLTVDVDLVKGIELKLSELLKKESLEEGSEGDREVKPASEPVLSARAPAPYARAARCSVPCELSPEADVDARFTSRVMITHDRERVSVVTSDTTRLMQHVTVHHTNLQDVPVSPSATSSLPTAVTVLNNSDTLSTVVCLEEGLADDDSWVEDVSHGEDAATTTDSDSDSGGEAALPARTADFGFCRRSLDFTLHTIVEESCEESDAEHVTKKKQRPISATELEKYFCYGLSDGRAVIDDGDQSSETSSVCSEGGSIIDNEPSEKKCDTDDLVSSRLEKYFLSGFMGFNQERRDSDGSGSVGSDSEGKQSPEQRRKRLVRARGTPRSHSSSLDNLLTGEEPAQDTQEHSDGSSTETEDRHDITEKCDTTSDTKRKKQSKKTRSPLSDDRRLSTEYPDETRDDTRSVSEGEDGKITPRPEFPLLGSELSESKKQTSRDSGFVGSCDDLLRNGDSSDFKLEPRNELEEIEEEIRPDIDERLDGIPQSRPPPTPLSRKDSFNNWSSDEETNLMMTKMRQFFKQMIASANVKTSTPTTTTVNSESTKPPKPPQLLYFESELTRLMKTVPGIRDEEVREIVEYLSSEDTWSDSYDSSDYAGSDLESCVNKSVLRKQISESCREIIDEFDRGSCVGGSLERDAAGAYQRLAATLSRVGEGSPPMFGKVMRHIGGRLVALMHEVSAGASASTDEDSASEPGALARSKSHDILEATTASRGSVASDCERFSWRGSFESALLAADSRGTLGGGVCEARRSPAGVELAAQRSHSRSCGAISGSEDRLWRGRRRASAPDTEPEEEQRSGSLPRLPSVAGAMAVPSAGPVKSARYRAPGFRSATRAASAPGLHVPRRRRPAPPQPHLQAPAAPASAPSLEDDVYISEGVPQGHATLPRRSNSPLPHDRDGDRDRFPINRSGLQARSESMASVYSGAGEGGRGTVAVKGEVQFSLLYNYRLGALEIGVRRCRDLAAVDVKKNRSDPYVKVYLLPDKSKSGKRKTKVKKNTLNPVFEETLTFTQPLASLSTRTLWLSVWHADMFGRNDFLGEVTLPLADVVFDDPGPMWYKLQERTEFDEQQSTKGDLIIGLKFEIQESSGNHSRAKGTLHVLVKEAKNLVATKPNGLSDVFCKSYLLPERGRLAKQKTSVSRRTLNPRWEHTFTYRGVTLHELSSRALELSLWDRDRLASNDFMGAVRLSLGTGKYLGASVNWMDSVGKEVTLWQTMMQRPNFWVEGSLPLRPQLNN